MLFAAIGLSMVFERRAFCRYLCPVGGFIGIYSQAAPIELRIKEKQVCAKCDGKPCYNGSADGYGCPVGCVPRRADEEHILWTVHGMHPHLPARQHRHQPASLLLLTWPNRPQRMDEAFKSLHHAGLGNDLRRLYYSAHGDRSRMRHTASGQAAWFVYALIFLVVIFILLPGFFSLGLLPTKSVLPLKRAFCIPLYGPHPLGLDVLGRLQPFVCPDQRILYSGISLRPTWTGLEPVWHSECYPGNPCSPPFSRPHRHWRWSGVDLVGATAQKAAQ